MSDFRAAQRVRLWNGTEDKGFAADKPLYLAISDGTEVASVNVSNQLEVAVGNTVTIQDGGGAISIDDGGNTITVDGSVTVSASDLDIRALSESEDSILIYGNDGSTNRAIKTDADGNVQVDIVSGAAAGYEYQDGDANTGAYGRLILGDDGTNLQTVKVDTNGELQVDVLNTVSIQDGGNTITVDGTVAATQSGTWDIASITNVVHVDDNSGSLTVDDGDGSLSIDDGDGSITVDGSVSISGSVAVTATQLDIDDLIHTTDSVAIGDGSSNILAIDGSGHAQIDIAAISLNALPVSKDSNVNSETNPIFVKTVNTVVSGSEVHDYDTASGVAKDGTDNHDYAVVNNTFLLKSVICSASGAGKYEVQVGPVASLASKAVQFGSASNPNVVFKFDPAIEVPATSTGTIRVIRRNDDNTAQDMYSTIIGNDIS